MIESGRCSRLGQGVAIGPWCNCWGQGDINFENLSVYLVTQDI